MRRGHTAPQGVSLDDLPASGRTGSLGDESAPVLTYRGALVSNRRRTSVLARRDLPLTLGQRARGGQKPRFVLDQTGTIG